MIQFFKDKWYYGAAALVLLLILVLVSRYMGKRKEKRAQYQKILKDQALNEALKNSRSRKNVFSTGSPAEPMKTGGTDGKKENAVNGWVVLQLSVMGAKAASYMLNPEDHVLLGSRGGMNDILLPGEGVAPQQCDIFLYQGQVYVKSLNPGYPVVLRRKRLRTIVGEQAVKLLTGDQLRIGASHVMVSLMDYKGKLK